MVDEDLRQFHLRFGIKQIRRVDQVLGLLLERERDLGMAMAQDVDGNPGKKIQVLTPLDIVHLGALPSGQRQGVPGIGIHQVLSGPLHQLFSQHTCPLFSNR